MNITNIKEIKEIEDFLAGSKALAFKIAGNKDEAYQQVRKILIQFNYLQCQRQARGIIIRFLCKITGYSRQQVTRLVKQYRDTGHIVRRQKTSNGFAKKYTDDDIRLLAQMDERHDTPNGAAVKKLCERAYSVYEQTEYQRLSGISIAHVYNLRRSSGYVKQRRTFEKTKYKASSIGERRKPQPQGQPGYLRIDTVHQGDLDGRKGVYHINVVDEVTQFEVVVSVEKISENHLIPALELILDAFPFVIKGFHSDNGSEYVNQRVAQMLEKLWIEFTKSRPRHTNDNALVEGKNAAVVRKTFGYSHIAQRFANRINEFNRDFLNPYVNYHRPCYFSVTIFDKKGKQRKKYPYEQMMTPYEKLKSLTDAQQYLKPGVSFTMLDEIMLSMTDNEAADKLQAAKRALFNEIHEQDKQYA